LREKLRTSPVRGSVRRPRARRRRRSTVVKSAGLDVVDSQAPQVIEAKQADIFCRSYRELTLSGHPRE
jgi:hypothetical protein